MVGSDCFVGNFVSSFPVTFVNCGEKKSKKSNCSEYKTGLILYENVKKRSLNAFSSRHCIRLDCKQESEGSERVNEDKRIYVFCDIGREKNTWMDAQWGRSSRRLEVHFLLDLIDFNNNNFSVGSKGNVEMIKKSAFCPFEINSNTMTYSIRKQQQSFIQKLTGLNAQNASVLRIEMEISKFERGDLYLPTTSLYINVPVYYVNARNGIIGKSGSLTIIQKRFGFRSEMRIVGRCKVDDFAFTTKWNDQPLPSSKITQGADSDWM